VLSYHREPARVTYRQSDRRTDSFRIARPRLHWMQRGKNHEAVWKQYQEAAFCCKTLRPLVFHPYRTPSLVVIPQSSATLPDFWDTRWNISQTVWYRLPIFQVDLHCVLHRVATSSCRGHVDELATEPFLLLHREHGTGYRRSWNCCDRRTRFVVIGKHFCFILSTGTKILIDSVMHPRSSSRRHNKVPQLQLLTKRRQTTR